jgi:hypothetical protein
MNTKKPQKWNLPLLYMDIADGIRLPRADCALFILFPYPGAIATYANSHYWTLISPIFYIMNYLVNVNVRFSPLLDCF